MDNFGWKAPSDNFTAHVCYFLALVVAGAFGHRKT
jgi:hypothetical protein